MSSPTVGGGAGNIRRRPVSEIFAYHHEAKELIKKLLLEAARGERQLDEGDLYGLAQLVDSSFTTLERELNDRIPTQ